MNKNELEYAKAQFIAQKTAGIFVTVRHLFSVIAVLIAIWLVFDGLHKVIGDKKPDSIVAIAKVIEAVHLGSILGYLWGAGATAAWYRERKGKKRAIVQKSRYQKKAEEGEPNRTSSKLTETGETPSED
jgi:hypothetical protein